MARLNFEDFINSLERTGINDVLLPFFLIFIIIFSVLEKTKILGEGKRNLNIGLAFIFGLLVVIPHVTGSFPSGLDPVEVINRALPSVSLVVVAVIALLILIGVFAHDRVMLGLTAPGWVGLFSIIAIVFIFGSAAGWWQTGFLDTLQNLFGSDALAILIMILVFGIVIAFITGGDGHGEKAGAAKKIGIEWDKLFGGGGGGH